MAIQYLRDAGDRVPYMDCASISYVAVNAGGETPPLQRATEIAARIWYVRDDVGVVPYMDCASISYVAVNAGGETPPLQLIT